MLVYNNPSLLVSISFFDTIIDTIHSPIHRSNIELHLAYRRKKNKDVVEVVPKV